MSGQHISLIVLNFYEEEINKDLKVLTDDNKILAWSSTFRYAVSDQGDSLFRINYLQYLIYQNISNQLILLNRLFNSLF